MFAANAYRIHFATPENTDALRRLAERGGQRPLDGRVLIGEIAGEPAAAVSLRDGRVISDSSPHTGSLVATLRMRAGAIRAYEATPSLRERLLAALRSYRGTAMVTPMPASRDGHREADHLPGSPQAIERDAA
jgi:hypothetical protein